MNAAIASLLWLALMVYAAGQMFGAVHLSP